MRDHLAVVGLIITVDLEQLAAAAFAEAQKHPHRSPQRRAACHLWVSLTVPPAASLSAARKAIRSFGDEQTQTAALELLARITQDDLRSNPAPEAAPRRRTR